MVVLGRFQGCFHRRFSAYPRHGSARLEPANRGPFQPCQGAGTESLKFLSNHHLWVLTDKKTGSQACSWRAQSYSEGAENETAAGSIIAYRTAPSLGVTKVSEERLAESTGLPGPR